MLSRVIDGRFAGPYSHQIVITHAEWRVVPTGEAMQRRTGLAVDETLRVWPSDGSDWGETIRLPWGRNESRHPTRGFLQGGGRRLGLLRFDCSHQYLGC